MGQGKLHLVMLMDIESEKLGVNVTTKRCSVYCANYFVVLSEKVLM